MTEQVIQMTDLQKQFDKQLVLRGINLNVFKGEIVGLIGPSGAGKSTIIKTALGMEKADGGQALVLNTKMPNRELLGRIGYMAQTDALYDALSGRENLEFFGQMKGLKKSAMQPAIAHVAAVVDLEADLNKRVSGYSGGMQRRLSLAIALLGDPELLILDEPTVGIDPALRRKIWAELHKLSANGHSVLITTHVMDEAELCSKVALLLDGRIMAFATPTDLKKQYGVQTVEDAFLKAEGEL
ncbi:ABC transporter ATP-binding protein [Lacticaseibacillus zhaodongensis]|uniref:ABC transporter ATP-binding protein n=1 Tax=Lacticaseibacillus zhaodongensis TaxID=2668065 RepID=UPI0012D2FAC3|nr:ABC transporter ATP-binding protein [Lacticaseibacillus zhaodongensis]